MGRTTRAFLTAAATGLAALSLAVGATSASAYFEDPFLATCTPVNTRYACNTKVSSLSYFKGWANVDSTPPCWGADPGPDAWAAANPPRSAWKWTSAGWSKRTFPAGTRVYVWPYSTGWSWVWTSTTGWLAMRDSDIVINQWHPPCMAP